MTEQVRVSDEEIAQVEQQVKKESAAESAAIEERVRREMATEQKVKELEASLAEQQRAAEKARADAEQAKREADELVRQQVDQRVRMELEARSKAPVSAASPFAEQQKKQTFTPEMVGSVDKASYEAFIEKARKPR